jgi:hypothetical protein
MQTYLDLEAQAAQLMKIAMLSVDLSPPSELTAQMDELVRNSLARFGLLPPSSSTAEPSAQR